MVSQTQTPTSRSRSLLATGKVFWNQGVLPTNRGLRCIIVDRRHQQAACPPTRPKPPICGSQAEARPTRGGPAAPRATHQLANRSCRGHDRCDRATAFRDRLARQLPDRYRRLDHPCRDPSHQRARRTPAAAGDDGAVARTRPAARPRVGAQAVAKRQQPPRAGRGTQTNSGPHPGLSPPGPLPSPGRPRRSGARATARTRQRPRTNANPRSCVRRCTTRAPDEWQEPPLQPQRPRRRPPHHPRPRAPD